MQKATEYLQKWAGNFQRNVSNSVSNLSLKDYIRLVIILGGYALLRPYLLKLAGKFQARDHERELDPNEMTSGAAMSVNALRGRVQVPGDSDEEEESSATGADWGHAARRHQREMISELLAAEERKLAEEQEGSDKDIEEFLE
ncbi:hypothetical protein FGG08_004367 [Glutinoglossum americanum]|uniref:DUF1531-domain-containing protein n=1 Tax=Glutinoglossum americanum TaxID=1670608 RepID=A0A9P8L401_9PEZI|nr:hypothetical protein FGG08_004367 [Glutinoglossum americanum]